MDRTRGSFFSGVETGESLQTFMAIDLHLRPASLKSIDSFINGKMKPRERVTCCCIDLLLCLHCNHTLPRQVCCSFPVNNYCVPVCLFSEETANEWPSLSQDALRVSPPEGDKADKHVAADLLLHRHINILKQGIKRVDYTNHVPFTERMSL